MTLMEGGNVIGKVHKIQAAPFSNEYRSMFQDHIREALTAFHDYVHKESGGQIHLFGPNAAALHLHADEAAFTGSSKHFMNRAMSNEQYNELKPEGMTGDIDVQYMPHPQIRRILVPESKKKIVDGVEHKWFKGGIQAGTKFGRFRVADSTSAGDTDHFVLHHEDFPHLRLQLDLEQSARPWVANQQGVMIPGNHNTDVVSSDASDSLHPQGPFKGVHHKHIIGLAAKAHPDNLKYAMRGLKPKEVAGHEVGITTHEDVAQRLFGVRDRKKMSSFTGAVDLIKTHYTPEQHRAILDNAENKEYGLPNHVKAYLHKHLGPSAATAKSVKLTEEVEQEHHIATTVLTGVDPFPHEGHTRDVAQLVHDLGGGFFPMSAKSSFPHKTREKIFSRQAKRAGLNVEPITVEHFDQIVEHAWNKVKDKKGKKTLHLVAGIDRKDMANKIATKMISGGIKNPGFTEVKVHTPDGTKRTHDFSGTRLRDAADRGDLDTFHEHLGPAFTREEAKKHMDTTKALLDSGAMSVKRK